MPWLRVVGAAVVSVVALARPRLLRDSLARDRVPAMAALDQLARIRERKRLVNVPAEQGLDAIPRRPVDQRFVLAGIPLSQPGRAAE